MKADLVVAEAGLSPLEIASAARSGRLEMKGLAEGDAGLLVGGVAVATGRIVARGGRYFLKIQNVFDESEEEANS